MRFRQMATYRGVPYEVGVGPSESDVVLFAACPPPEELGFEPAPGHWRKRVIRAEVNVLWESRPIGTFHGEACLVLDDLGDRLHIVYLGKDARRARELGFWQVDRGVFELLTPRDEVTSLTEEKVEKNLSRARPEPVSAPLPSYPYGAQPWSAAATPAPAPAEARGRGYPADRPWPRRAPGLGPAARAAHRSGTAPAGTPHPAATPRPAAQTAGPATAPARSPRWPDRRAASTGMARPGPAREATVRRATGMATAPPAAPAAGPATAPAGPRRTGPGTAARPTGTATVSRPRRGGPGTARRRLATGTGTARRRLATGTVTVRQAGWTGNGGPVPAGWTGNGSAGMNGHGPVNGHGTGPWNGMGTATQAPRSGPNSILDGTPLAGPSRRAQPTAGRRSARKQRVQTRSIFSELADLAAIPRSAYALEQESDGAMCLLRTDEGFEVFSAADGARHEVRTFEDEEAAYFYLFGVLAAEAVRNGSLIPPRR